MFLTTGEVGLVAAVLTATAGFGGAWMQSRRDDRRWKRERENEKQRWRRDEITRWHDARLNAYVDFISMMDTLRLAVYDGGDDPDLITPDDYLTPALTAYQRTLLLATPRTGDAAEVLWRRGVEYIYDVKYSRASAASGNELLIAAVREFRNEIRRELAIELPEANLEIDFDGGSAIADGQAS